MSVMDEFVDKRGLVIDRMNAGRKDAGFPALTPRQEHLVREFFDDEGVLAEEDKPLLLSLLQSN